MYCCTCHQSTSSRCNHHYTSFTSESKACMDVSDRRKLSEVWWSEKAYQNPSVYFNKDQQSTSLSMIEGIHYTHCTQSVSCQFTMVCNCILAGQGKGGRDRDVRVGCSCWKLRHLAMTVAWSAFMKGHPCLAIKPSH